MNRLQRQIPCLRQHGGTDMCPINGLHLAEVEAELAQVRFGNEGGVAARVTSGDQKVDDCLAQMQAPGYGAAARVRVGGGCRMPIRDLKPQAGDVGAAGPPTHGDAAFEGCCHDAGKRHFCLSRRHY